MHGGGVANAEPKYPPEASGGYNELYDINFTQTMSSFKIHQHQITCLLDKL